MVNVESFVKGIIYTFFFFALFNHYEIGAIILILFLQKGEIQVTAVAPSLLEIL